MLEAPDGLKPTSIYLYEASVTGTETALLAAAGAPGITEIRHAACEPHVVELCEFLEQARASASPARARRRFASKAARSCAAPSTGCGATTSRPAAGRSSRPITGGEIEVRGARAEDMEVVAAVLKRMNIECAMDGDVFRVEQSTPRAAGRITTGLWPGFPSDLVSLVTVLATQAEGRTLVHDWLYELRLFALEQLSGMSADLFLCDPHRIIVTGPQQLRGRPLDSRDLRSGMALIAAALAADGQSRLVAARNRGARLRTAGGAAAGARVRRSRRS